jgi:hypothetical protein
MNNEALDYAVLNEIVRCIQDAVGFGRDAFEGLSLATDIARDLGVDGDDANELMSEFFEKFAMKIDGYDAYRYFVPEGYDLLSFRRNKDRRGNIPLRLGMLYLAVKSGAWDAAFESAAFGSEPIYRRTEDIPISGYKIKSR